MKHFRQSRLTEDFQTRNFSSSNDLNKLSRRNNKKRWLAYIFSVVALSTLVSGCEEKPTSENTKPPVNSQQLPVNSKIVGIWTYTTANDLRLQDNNVYEVAGHFKEKGTWSAGKTENTLIFDGKICQYSTSRDDTIKIEKLEIKCGDGKAIDKTWLRSIRNIQ